MFVGISNLMFVVCYYFLMGDDLFEELEVNVCYGMIVMVICYKILLICGF